MAEALGAVKAKWTHGRITEDQYFVCTRTLVINAWSKKIEVEDIGIFSPTGAFQDASNGATN